MPTQLSTELLRHQSRFALVCIAALHYIPTMTENAIPIGADVIREALETMPGKPGVYIMRDADGEPLYVGKAKHLKNRVSNYTSVSGLTYRIMRMVSQVAKVDITLAQSEAEALLIEANLIKQYQPKYNILLKDDKSFPHILIEDGHPFPRIRKHRGAQTTKGKYFGPFASVGAVNETLTILQKAFLLRPCSDHVFANRSRPCLQYQIKRCSAPCVDYISEEAYGESIAEASDFMRGKSREVQARFAEQMQRHSESEEYEKAAMLRDRIRALTQVQQEQNLRARGLEDADVLAMHREGQMACIQVLIYRGGNPFGSQTYFPSQIDKSGDDGLSDSAVLAAFIGQFYQQHTPPLQILCSSEPDDATLLAEALGMRIGRQVQLLVPQRGDKADLMRQATEQARLALERRQSERLAQAKQVERLAELLGLNATPKRIEVYDNSHLMGRYALGAMIVAGPEGFEKKAYRRFNMKDMALTPGDDYGMMREMFTRRFQRLKREAAVGAAGWPDLVLIDGGAGQLSAVEEVLEKLELTGEVCCVAIAKGPDRNAGRETFFMPGREPFMLPPGDAALHYLQRLRDEAHRFAIGGHRSRRAKSITQSALDDIPGIGGTRKRALMHHFGSKSGVERATLAELEKVPGINRKVARTIYDYFHGG